MAGQAGERGIRGVTRRLTRAAWVEGALFEVVGGWVAGVPEPAAKAALLAHSRHLGWRAQLWTDIAPRLWDGSDGGEAAVTDVDRALVAGVAAAPGTPERLAGLYQVALPHLRARHQAELGAASPTAEAWLARWLGVACADLAADEAEGAALVASVVAADPEAADRAERWRAARAAEVWLD